MPAEAVTVVDLSPSPSPLPNDTVISLSPNDTLAAPSPSPLPNDTVISLSPNDTLAAPSPAPLRRHLLQFDESAGSNFTEGNVTSNFTGVEFQDTDDFTGNATSNFTGVEFQDTDDTGSFTAGNATSNFTGVEFQDTDDFANTTGTNTTTDFTTEGSRHRRAGRKLLRGRHANSGSLVSSSAARRRLAQGVLIGSDDSDDSNITVTPGTGAETNVTGNITDPMMVVTPDLGPVMVEYAINVTMNDTTMTQLGVINATTGNTTVEFAEPEDVLFLNATTGNDTTGNDTVPFGYGSGV